MYPRWNNVIFGEKGEIYDKRYFERNDIRFVIVDKKVDRIVRDTQFFDDTNGFYIFKANLDK